VCVWPARRARWLGLVWLEGEVTQCRSPRGHLLYLEDAKKQIPKAVLSSGHVEPEAQRMRGSHEPGQRMRVRGRSESTISRRVKILQL